ncbi:MAG TPA: hypothetical protein VNM14_23620 [Planctomycetota bacterium]|jgi:hypothetical protein|nr:hypothetical protein [Planctomycetota bacterium]
MIPALLLLAAATPSWAQDDALLPTHLIDGGQVFVTGTFQYLEGHGDAQVLGLDGDFDQKAYQVRLDGGVGLGMGFEIDASIVGQFRGTTDADFANGALGFESESRGFSDLTVAALYRILKDDSALPQLIVGGILVAPVGNDKKGQSETVIGGVRIQDKEESGIGQGVWHYGIEAGISKNLSLIEPYLLTSYVFGGRRHENGVTEDRADTWNVLVGAQWHLSPQATIDTRAIFSRDGIDRQEDNGSQVKEHNHFTYSGEVDLYAKLGGGVTLILGGGAFFVEDHELNDLAQLNVKNDYVWYVQVGLHLLLGGKK